MQVQRTGGIGAATSMLAAGAVVVLYDEKNLGHGGYLCCSAVRATVDSVNFMISRGRGLTCLALSEKRMQALGIPMLAADSTASRRLAFGASIEARRGVSTGISAADRTLTILAASRPDACPDDIVMPGHVFPIQAVDGGVLVRAGIPEAATDLVRMAGDEPAAALSAVLDDDGELASQEGLARLAADAGLNMVSVGAVVDERLKSDLVVERVAERDIESGFGGLFRAIVYRNAVDSEEHMALVAGDVRGGEPVVTRVHSQCLTGDVLGSTRCDCGDQLELALNIIHQQGRGVVVYMHQEGRGIGLANKIKAYALQDLGRDTVEANLELGFDDDLRDYGITSQILKDLGATRVRLLTNNPKKVESLERYGIEVVERCPIEAEAHEENIGYLRTKQAKLGHLFDSERLRDGEGRKR
ncbi:MAG: GTP cyclohydrolase II [Deltaproteobacteria bacterium]